MPVVAGSGTWLYGASAYVEELCAIPGLYGIDLHVYPVNMCYLDQALALADLAHSHGKRVTMLEAWLQKERDSELSVVDPAVDPALFARDAYDFWAPLDSAFLATMVKYAHVARLEYFSPFWSRYFFAYLDYDQVQASDPPLTDAQIVGFSATAAASALLAGRLTDTARAYTRLIGEPLFQPNVRRHLQQR